MNLKKRFFVLIAPAWSESGFEKKRFLFANAC